MLQLRPQDLQTLRRALSPFTEIRHAGLFGSRAVGTARRASDIDLAIETPALSGARWQALLDALEHAPLIYPLDIVRLDTLDDPALRQTILDQRTPLEIADY